MSTFTKVTHLVEDGVHFIKTGIWRIRLKDLDKKKRILVSHLRIVLIAGKEFITDNCPLRASGLTFYTLLSIVPVMAMAFAVAKGFGFQSMLEKQLLEQFSGQQEVLNKAMEYARTLLKETKGGLLAGIGAAVLLWSVIRVLHNIEQTFNNIWGNTRPRRLGQKFSNYLAIILISPLLLIMSGSASVIIVSQITTITEKIAILGFFSPIIMLLLKLVPLGFILILFAFIYIFMPNTKVAVKSSLIGAVVAATAFKILQWAYIYFQVGVSRYNAIYGSFAALPLFLIWLHLSWLIVLFGAELSFAHQNEAEYELEPDSRQISHYLTRLLGLYVLHLLVKTFQKGEKPLTAGQISQALDMPIRLIRIILSKLSEAGLITSVLPGEGQEIAYQPGQDIHNFTISAVFEALDKNGTNELPVEYTREFYALSAAVDSLYDEIEKSPNNTAVKEI